MPQGNFAVAGLSHAPVFGRVDPGGSIYAEILDAIERTQKFVVDFDPEVVVSFGPDHFNGVLYEMMPPFCIGAQAFGIGDWGTYEGPLPVDAELARRPHYDVLDQGTYPKDNTGIYSVPAGHVFLMGDNRDNSTDSRFSHADGGIEFVPLENLEGKAVVSFWSTDGSANWFLPWTWFTAARWGRIGEGF